MKEKRVEGEYWITFCKTYSRIQVVTIRILIIFKITKKIYTFPSFSCSVAYFLLRSSFHCQITSQKLPRIPKKYWIDYRLELYFSFTNAMQSLFNQTIFGAFSFFPVSYLLTCTLYPLQKFDKLIILVSSSWRWHEHTCSFRHKFLSMHLMPSRYNHGDSNSYLICTTLLFAMHALVYFPL